MQQFYFLCLFVFCVFSPCCAQDCYERFLAEGKAHYDNQQYRDARKSFQQAIECPTAPKDVSGAKWYLEEIRRREKPKPSEPTTPPKPDLPSVTESPSSLSGPVDPRRTSTEVSAPPSTSPPVSSAEQAEAAKKRKQDSLLQEDKNRKAAEKQRKQDSLWNYVNDLRTAYGYSFFIRTCPQHPQVPEAERFWKNARLDKPVKPATVLFKKQRVEFPKSGTDMSAQHEVLVPEQYVGTCEITNTEYCVFLNEAGDSSATGLCYIHLDGAQQGERCRIIKRGLLFEVQKGYEDYPVIFVTWHGANAYCDWLNTKYPVSFYQLPAEALLEGVGHIRVPPDVPLTVKDLIARMNSKDPNDGFPAVARCGRFPKNDFGLFDVLGNVAEWCADNWAEKVTDLPSDGQPCQKGKSGEKAVRGGAWNQHVAHCYPTNRIAANAREGYAFIGFRVVSQRP